MHVKGPRRPLNSDRDAILSEVSSSDSHQTSRSKECAPPLSGIRVIDASQLLAGPTACRILAQYGAEVIQICDPHPKDETAGGLLPLFVDNGKRSIVLNLKSSDGRSIIGRLVERADVFHHNFSLGTAERLGVGEADLRRLRPDIVYSVVNCHSEGGFRAHYRGHKELGEAVAGMEVRAGGDEPPDWAGWLPCDVSTGHLSAFGILLALFHRIRTGEGQRVHAALSRSATFLQIPFMIEYQGHVWDEPQGHKAKGWGPLYCLYKASDNWFFLAAHREGDLNRLGAVVGLEGIAEIAVTQLGTELESRFASASAEQWVSEIRAAGVSAHILVNYKENMEGQLAKDRGLSILRTHPGIGQTRNVGPLVRFSGTPLLPLFSAPPIGTHSREILEEVGCADRFDEFLSSGVVVAPSGN
jgi:crotonobetainyl-CoA:carnitine CoA-transferase CaiB-like acyl-CoA transferase